eukprot:3085048-Pleurochrysis_carterae.AAC.2
MQSYDYRTKGRTTTATANYAKTARRRSAGARIKRFQCMFGVRQPHVVAGRSGFVCGDGVPRVDRVLAYVRRAEERGDVVREGVVVPEPAPLAAVARALGHVLPVERRL